jgi:serine/threonine-protein kinase
MGAVVRGRDELLGRDVAVKVLHDRLLEHHEIRVRFHDEARIGGQLQHPGVVPVYDLGHLADGRPFFAMKLVKGRTLAALLAERASPVAEQGRFLQIFHQVCQTMAYAHSHHVIHRDLKPANIMVGPFGEVLVMDWGLGKVLGTAQERPTEADAGPLPSTIETTRAASPEQQTSTGAVLGTFAYMAPEQAAGQIDRLDQRCDVFSLGAILCEILIGRAPYQARDLEGFRIQALTADQSEALALLAQPQVEGYLATLARSCLARNPEGRPPDAAAVAEAMQRYFDDVQERLRQAEVARAEAQVKAQEERKRRRITAYLAAAVLATVGIGIAAYVAVSQQRQARQQQTAQVIKEALSEARTLQKQARGLREEPARAVPIWQAALARADQAVTVGGKWPGDEELATEIRSLLTELRAEVEEAEKDRVMLERLDRARDLEHELQEDDFIRIKNPRYFVFGQAAAPAYATAFREYGIDVASLSAEEAVARIRARPIHFRLAVGLDDWYFLDPKGAGGRLLEISRAADPDPLRDRFRAAIAAGDLAGLERLAADGEAATLPPPTLILTAFVLHQHDRPAAALDLLRRAQQRNRNDFWINDVLGLHTSHNDPPDYQQAVSCFTAAVALRPDSAVGWNNLGMMLASQGLYDAAIRALREGIAARGDVLYSWRELSAALLLNHQTDEALAVVEKALKRWPQSPMLQAQLAEVRYAQGKRDDAETLLRQVLAERPEFFRARIDLAEHLCDRDRPQDAERLLNDYHSPGYDQNPFVHLARSDILCRVGKQQEALQECEMARQLSGGGAQMSVQMGAVYLATNQVDRAIDVLHQAVNQAPANAAARAGLAIAYRVKGRGDEAAAQAAEALRLDPQNPVAHHEQALFLMRQTKYAAAAAEFRIAIRLAPQHPLYYTNLAEALAGQNDFAGAEEAVRKGIERAASLYKSGYNARAGDIFWYRNRFAESIPYYREAIHLQKDTAPGWLHHRLGVALGRTGDYAAAAEALRIAKNLDPAQAQVRADLAFALAHLGQLDEALEEGRAAVRLGPTIARAHNSLATALEARGNLDEAIPEYRAAARLAPADIETLSYLSGALMRKEQFDEAVGWMKEAVRLQEKNPLVYARLSLALQGARRYLEAIEAAQKAVDLQPTNAASYAQLVTALWDAGDVDRAEAATRKVIAIDPTRPEGYFMLGRLHLARKELAAAADAFKDAIGRAAGLPGGYVSLGHVLRLQGDDRKAEQLYRFALLLDSRFLEGRLALGRLHLDHHQAVEAEAEFRRALRDFPRSGPSMAWLSQALAAQGKADAAFQAASDAVRWTPLASETHFRLGEAQLLRGAFLDALHSFREAKRLVRPSQDVNNPLPIDERIGEAGRCLELDGVLAAVQSKRVRLTDTTLLAELARFCAERRNQPATAVRLWLAVFAADAALGDDLDAGHRHRAACAAVCAAAGEGDATKSSGEERNRWRQQALDWLRADLAVWKARLEKCKPQERDPLLRRLRDCREDGVLARVPSDDALPRLPAEEQKSWRALWADWDALLKGGR